MTIKERATQAPREGTDGKGMRAGLGRRERLECARSEPPDAVQLAVAWW
jgi:hypothetical protein